MKIFSSEIVDAIWSVAKKYSIQFEHTQSLRLLTIHKQNMQNSPLSHSLSLSFVLTFSLLSLTHTHNTVHFSSSLLCLSLSLSHTHIQKHQWISLYLFSLSFPFTFSSRVPFPPSYLFLTLSTCVGNLLSNLVCSVCECI